MPWCPNCKNEYREGILKCADCGADLVAELETDKEIAPLCYQYTEDTAKKLVEYLRYSKIASQYRFDENENAFLVTVFEEDHKKALVEYKAFVTVEANAIGRSQIAASMAKGGANPESDSDEAQGDDPELSPDIEIDEEAAEAYFEAAAAKMYKPAGIYQSQSEKAHDYSATGYTFIFVGIVLFVFTILNFCNVISVFYENYPTLIILLVLAIAACGVGIGAFKRSKNAGSQVAAEEKLTSDINEWLEKNKSIMTAGPLSGDDGTPDEVLYLKRTEAMKSALFNVFGPLDEDYVDSLIDDFYNKTF